MQRGRGERASLDGSYALRVIKSLRSLLPEKGVSTLRIQRGRAAIAATIIGFTGLALGAVSGAPALASAHSPMTRAVHRSFVTFSAFIKGTDRAGFSSYAARGRLGAVRGSRAFDQMRSYILATYRGVKVEHSFVLGGSYFDCVTITSQPTVRDLGVKTIARPPAVASRASRVGSALPSPLTLGRRDAYGHAISCPAGTIPMQRISLARTTRFPTLAAFLAKGPRGADGRPTITPGGPHRYAYGWQSVTNYGGNSWLDVWNPSGPFTLAQQWYVNGSGSGTQTVEGGWVHYPAKFGSKSVLFIFSTPNDYSSGCYNLECSGFVQTSSSIALGGQFTNYSSYGGTQWGFGLQWKYYNGVWWMFYQNAAVGYYPASVFDGGPMAKNADLTEYGGETYTSGKDWPQMGSGFFASAGYSHVSFQKTIFYIPSDVNGGTGVWSSLTPVQTNPKCYTIKYVDSAHGGSWGTYFNFGGPGGDC
jgi:hypothetical protein